MSPNLLVTAKPHELAQRTRALLEPLASTPIAGHVNLRTDRLSPILEELSTLPRETLAADLHAIDTALSQGIGTAEEQGQIFLPLAAKPAQTSGEEAGTAYGLMLRACFEGVPLWALKIAVLGALKNCRFRPQPDELEAHLPREYKRLKTHRIALNAALDYQERAAKKERQLAAFREANWVRERAAARQSSDS